MTTASYDSTRRAAEVRHRERVRKLAAAIEAFDNAPQRSSAHLATLCARWMAASREVVDGFK